MKLLNERYFTHHRRAFTERRMYLQKGQSVFSVYNPDRAWAILNIYGESQSLVKVGNTVRVIPETAPASDFRATIDFIEPFYRKENKTLTARVYFNNSTLKIPIGSQVRATIFGNTKDAYWLPKKQCFHWVSIRQCFKNQMAVSST
jgi:Cu(I)/Ag(I) efflux system membrane fusion protein